MASDPQASRGRMLPPTLAKSGPFSSSGLGSCLGSPDQYCNQQPCSPEARCCVRSFASRDALHMRALGPRSSNARKSCFLARVVRRASRGQQDHRRCAPRTCAIAPSEARADVGEKIQSLAVARTRQVRSCLAGCRDIPVGIPQPAVPTEVRSTWTSYMSHETTEKRR
jgi:hypothetical protein